jgi:CRP-like cAMP-binding protein
VYDLGYETENYDLNRKYMAALYFMLVTLTTVGYGDINIITLQERILNIFVMIIGTTVFGYLIASVSSLVGSLNRTAALQQDRISEISAYLHERKCPRPLVKSIRKYFNHIFEHKTAYDESAILSRLPMNLKNEILYFKNAESIMRIPLLHHLENHSVILYIFEKLVYAYFEPESVIISEGSPVSGIYFLTSGKASISKATSDIELEKYQRTYKDLRTTILFSKESRLDRYKNLNRMHSEKAIKEKASEKVTSKFKTTYFNFHFRKNPVAVTDEVTTSLKINSFKSHSDLFEEEMSKISSNLYSTNYIPMKRTKVQPTVTEEFIMRGMKNDSVVLGELNAGQFVGHTAFMNQSVQPVSVESITACTFFTLNKNTFQNILIEQPCIALNLQIALAKSISELKNISGKYNIWEEKNNFVKALHVTHINVKKKKIDFKTKKTILPIKHKRKSSLVNFKLDIQKMSKAKNIKRSLKHFGGDYKIVAQSHWDFIRHLIKATARQSIVAVAAGSKFDPNNTPSKPMAQKSIHDPLKQQRNKIAAFSRNLKLRIGLELGRMIDTLLKIDEDELDNQHNTTSIRHNFKRVKSLPHIPSDNYSLKTFDSLKTKKFRILKRRQSFPSTDFDIWANDHKSRNIY